MPAIKFETRLFKIHDWTILQLPKDASNKLPSRSMNMAAGTINGFRFQLPLEPDGKGSHWMRADRTVLSGAKASAGDTVAVEIEPVKEWPRPEVPEDIKNGLAKVPEAAALWSKITPKAQWEWIRWIRSTKQAETRQRHIEVACSKMKRGERRPCCFNSGMNTEPAVSHNGMLVEPAAK